MTDKIDDMKDVPDYNNIPDMEELPEFLKETKSLNPRQRDDLLTSMFEIMDANNLSDVVNAKLKEIKNKNIK